MKQYRKRDNQPPVIAIKLKLDLKDDVLLYQKWGGDQTAKKGDWLLNNSGEVYTVDADSFADTYENVGHGQYRKVAIVYAEIADEPGFIPTKEGQPEYEAGDYLVYNKPDREDGYRIKPSDFLAMYEEAN